MSDDPYTIEPGATRQPPTTWAGRLKNLGPGIVVSGSIVGSGEILLTAGLGAAAGFTLLWWVLFSCWVKSL
ncbi:MAG: divalent metal cation transporter, partial [Pseudomonadota bacterium]|nr:divalent metal cation transporter [Pseudomonadota bacterium]